MCILYIINSWNHCGNCTYKLDWTLSTLRRYDGVLCEEYSVMIYETGSDLGLQRVEWLWRPSFRKYLFYTVYWTLMGFIKTLAFGDGTGCCLKVDRGLEGADPPIIRRDVAVEQLSVCLTTVCCDKHDIFHLCVLQTPCQWLSTPQLQDVWFHKALLRAWINCMDKSNV